jgi:ribonuclease P protein component
MEDEARGLGGGSLSLPPEARITTADDIRALFRRGKRRKTRYLDVFISTSPVSRSRIGLVIPKPRAKTSPDRKRVRAAAVQRNRLKRRLREIARTTILPQLSDAGCAVDILVRGRPETYKATFGELREDLLGLQEWMCSNAR